MYVPVCMELLLNLPFAPLECLSIRYFLSNSLCQVKQEESALCLCIMYDQLYIESYIVAILINRKGLLNTILFQLNFDTKAY